MPQLFGPGDKRSIPGNLVVLDRLRVVTMAASSTALSSISPAVSSDSLMMPSIAGQSVPSESGFADFRFGSHCESHSIHSITSSATCTAPAGLPASCAQNVPTRTPKNHLG